MNTDAKLSLPSILPIPGPAAAPLDITAHREWFTRYTRYEMDICSRELGPMELKVYHTFCVLDNMTEIVQGEGFPPPLARACLLAALYHDIGRFEQYRIWNTFRDSESESHGVLGARLLREIHILSKEPLLARTVIKAVGLHNSFRLPSSLATDVRITTQAVRDADKLDIMRVMDSHLSKPGPYSPTIVLGRPDDPTLYSEKVIQAALAGKVASYEDLKSVNDFRLLLGTWIFALVYPSSRRILYKAGHAKHLVEGLPSSGPYARARHDILAAIAGMVTTPEFSNGGRYIKA